MLEHAVWYIMVLGTAVLFYGIGVYAAKKETPMSFWAGTTVDPLEITDVAAYNRANSIMWKTFSLWFWISGFSMAWNAMVSFILLMAGGTIGIVLLIHTYRRIEQTYKQ